MYSVITATRRTARSALPGARRCIPVQRAQRQGSLIGPVTAVAVEGRSAARTHARRPRLAQARQKHGDSRVTGGIGTGAESIGHAGNSALDLVTRGVGRRVSACWWRLCPWNALRFRMWGVGCVGGLSRPEVKPVHAPTAYGASEFTAPKSGAYEVTARLALIGTVRIQRPHPRLGVVARGQRSGALKRGCGHGGRLKSVFGPAARGGRANAGDPARPLEHAGSARRTSRSGRGRRRAARRPDRSGAVLCQLSPNDSSASGQRFVARSCLRVV